MERLAVIRTHRPKFFPGMALNYSRYLFNDYTRPQGETQGEIFRRNQMVIHWDGSVAGLDPESESWAFGESLPLHQVLKSLLG